jgi:hypothetical protein
MRPIVLVGIVLALVLVGVVVWKHRTEKFRFRMTVEIDTPAGLRSGSSVIENRIRHFIPIMMDGAGIQFTTRGEAVAVDLPDGRTLFLLVRPDYNYLGAVRNAANAGSALPVFARQYDFQSEAKFARDMRRTGAVVTIPPSEHWTRMIWFRDPADPGSFEQVDPAALAASLGPGISLRRITVRASEEEIGRDILKRLPWVAEGSVWLSTKSKESRHPDPKRYPIYRYNFVGHDD